MKLLSRVETTNVSGGAVAHCETEDNGTIVCEFDIAVGRFGGPIWMEGENGSWAYIDAAGNAVNGNYSIGGP
jgi:hypothetical protein